MSRHPRHYRRAFLLLSIFLGGLAAPLWAQRISNPNLYGKSLKAAAQAFDYYGEYDDAEERRRVNEIGYRLAAVSDFEDFPFAFYLVDMPVPNAFALPGGHIFVTKGMLDLGLDDDMLACLLGHELAHVIYEHGSKMKRRATLLNLLSTAALLGVMVGASDEPENPYAPYGYGSGSRKGSLVEGTAAAGMALTELLLRDYSRDFEDEADVEGQRLAAGAGYDPAGAHQLWQLMNARIPQAKIYGYWRTHPFSDQRMRAAEVRAAELKIQRGESPDAYRTKVQELVLDYDGRVLKGDKEGELALFVEYSALHAWPRGARADELRLTSLHRRRDAEAEKSELERDYGALMRAYGAQLEEVRLLTPESTVLAALEKELEELRASTGEILPKAREVWRGGIYQTPFLETFLSNHPEAAEAPDIALALGNAYSRLGRQTDAVDQFLRASEAGAESEAARRALLGLKNLTPYLDRLAALRQLAEDVGDAELRELSEKRLAELAPEYEGLENGAEYLKRYPLGPEADVVRERLESLANDLHGEVLLYQQVGDHVKALERIQEILTHAPLTRAAEALRDKAVFDG